MIKPPSDQSQTCQTCKIKYTLVTDTSHVANFVTSNKNICLIASFLIGSDRFTEGLRQLIKLCNILIKQHQ